MALAVLATLWEVADASTGQLMREFYRQRVQSAELTKAEALRRRTLIARGSRGRGWGFNHVMRSSERLNEGASPAPLGLFKVDPNAKQSSIYWPFHLDRQREKTMDVPILIWHAGGAERFDLMLVENFH